MAEHRSQTPPFAGLSDELRRAFLTQTICRASTPIPVRRPTAFGQPVPTSDDRFRRPSMQLFRPPLRDGPPDDPRPRPADSPTAARARADARAVLGRLRRALALAQPAAAPPPGRLAPDRCAREIRRRSLAPRDQRRGAVQPGEGLLEQRVAVGVAAPLAHVGQVGLVRLGPRRRRRVLLVLPGRQAAARAVPQLRHVGLGGERHPRLVQVRAPEGDPVAGRGLAALGLTHRTCSDPGTPDRVATCHERPLRQQSGSMRQITAARAV